MPTDRLYYSDCYLAAFDAQTVSVSPDGLRVVLDRSAFYPASGGQLFDTGVLGGSRVIEVIDEGDAVVHVLDGPVAEGSIRGVIDWPRRFAFMQQHTAQHLLSAVFHSLFGYETVSVHLGEHSATVELAVETIAGVRLAEAEAEANARITANVPVSISFEENPEGLRKASVRSGPLRVVEIAGIDKSACGGTHVRTTGEIGALLLRGQEKIRGNTRLEFVSGGYAIRQARADFERLSAIGKGLSRPLEELPAAVAGLQETAKDLSKQVRALSLELAGHRGRALFAATPAGSDGLRRCWQQLDAIDDAVRAMAQAFTACGGGIFLATGGGAALLACSSDAPIHCGNVLKQFGRGGGSAVLAQGSAAEPGLLSAALGF